MQENLTEISDFILKHVEEHPNDIVSLVSDNFGLSRQKAHLRVVKEVKRGKLIQAGRTRATRYFRVGGKHIQFSVDLKPEPSEDKVWSDYVKPMLKEYTENVRRIANYGFNEMLNNAIDHSEGSSVWISMKLEDNNLCITLTDNGVGIFKKITKALKLPTEREAILHLSKGKFTTDPAKHTGQGIFFTSRMVGKFSILSDDLYYSFKGQEWFLSPERQESFGHGTLIRMEIPLDTRVMPNDVMSLYSDIETGFHKTSVAVALSSNLNDPHNSRSQAKRLMMGLEKFTTVVLDFSDIKEVGQAFVDEVFRVFRNEHPGIRIEYINTSPEVDAMIKSGIANAQTSSN